MKKLILAAAIAATTFLSAAPAQAYMLRMAQAERIANREARKFADIGESYGVNNCERWHAKRIDCEIYSYDALESMTCTATVTIVVRGHYAYWSGWRGIDCNSDSYGDY